MIFQRIVIYNIEAPNEELAMEEWDAYGPELADEGKIAVYDSGPIVEVPE